MSYKTRLQRAFPIFSAMFSRTKSPAMQTIIAGGTAGDHTVAGIKKNDELVGIVHVDIVLTDGTPNTRAWTINDLKSEFTVSDGKINNVGGTNTTGGFLIVTWFAWTE